MTKTSPRYATRYAAETLQCLALTIGLLVLSAGSHLHAGSHTWTGAVNHLWSNPGNWQSGGVPAAGEPNLVLYFPAGATTYLVSNNIVGLTVQSMVFSATYVVRGNGVTLAPENTGWNFHVSGVNKQARVMLPLTLPSGEFTVRATSSCRLDLEGAISGPGSLHKDDDGTLVIAGDSGNTFTGGFHQRGGTVYLYKQSGVALPGPVVVGVSNSTVAAVLEYSDHHQIADVAEIFLHGSEARLDLDGFDDTIGSLTMVESMVSTEGFSTVGQLRLNGDLTARRRNTQNNYVPMVFGRLSLGNVAHNFHVATNSSLYVFADIESTGIVGGINVRGGGYVRLEGSNSFGGLLRLIEGSVQVEHPHALGSTTGATSLEGGRLIVGDLWHTFLEPLLVKSTNATVYCYGTNTWNGLIQIDPGTKLLLYGPSFNTPDVWTLGGVISGAGDLHISSMEVDIVGGAGNTFSGRTDIRGSAVVRMNKTSGHALSGNVIHLEGGSVLPQLRWKRSHQVPDNTRIEFPGSSTASGELHLENHSDTIGSIHHGWNALISCGTGTLTIGADNLDGDFVGTIFGNSSTTNLIKTGTGSFTLRGSHSLLGKTVVNGGALILDNASGVGPVHVSNGARLAGRGGFGALTVGPTASITPGLSLGGSSYGTLRPATFNLGGGYLGMQLGGTNAGFSHDQIVVAGPVNLNGVLLQLSALNLPHGSNSFTLLDVTSGAITGTFVGAPEGTVFPSSDGKLFRITYQGGTGNDVVVTRHYTVPPTGTMTGVSRLPDGRMRIGGTGLPFELYRVLANTNLSTTNWIAIGSVSSGDEFGTLEFLDNDAPNHPMRFYQFVLP